VFIGDYFSVQPELLFSYKTVGTESIVLTNIKHHVGEHEYFPVKSTDVLWYASIPVNLKISYPFISGRPFISVAPMLDLGLYGKNELDDYDELKSLLEEMKLPVDRKKLKNYDQLLFQANPNDPAFDYRVDQVYRNVNFSLLFKAGLDFTSGFCISAAYQLGLTNMYNMAPKAEAFYRSFGMKLDQKMHTFSVSLGVKF